MAMPLAPATQRRDWMDRTWNRFAYRCLPLVIANQSGWVIQSAHTLKATWNGSDALNAVTIEHLDGQAQHSAASHFGAGVLTFHIPYLFRTPPGWNLLARGPVNNPKDGISPLEGIVETDWTAATFTMNWKFTRPDFPVIFEQGETVCMVVPQRRGELERFTPEIRAFDEQADDARKYAVWSISRSAFNEALRVSEPEAVGEGWQRNYMKGRDLPGQAPFPGHQSSLKLAPVTDRRKK